MKNKYLMTFTKMCFAALITLVATAASASAQSFINIRANIPFDFTVGEKTLPAGKYIVQRADPGSPAVLLIRSEDGKAAAIRTTNAVQANIPPDQAKLIFHRYETSYFLSEVWTDGDDTGRRLLESHSERELARGLATHPSPGEPAKKVSETITKMIVVAAS